VAEAIFGLVGVVVGALVTGGVEFLSERRRDAALLLKAARLVEAELDEAESAFKHALDQGRLWASQHQPSVPSWREYAPVLAEALGTSDWQVVESAVAIIRFATVREPEQPLGQEGISREDLQQGLRVVAAAGLILRHVAGDDDEPLEESSESD
jgi:hypothetical protein